MSEVLRSCSSCGSLECQGECSSYEFCEYCGSVGCTGQCRRCPQCGKVTCHCPPEAPGAALARNAQDERETIQRGIVRLADERLFPLEKPLPATSVEEFDEALSRKRSRRVIDVDESGFQYRRKT